MNADAFSDVVLLLVCAALAWRTGRQNAAWTGGLMVLGLAAGFGVLRYSGIEGMPGPHYFTIVLAACAAFGLMMIALRWPQSPTVKRQTAAWRYVIVVGGFGVGFSLTIAPWWALVALVLSLLGILLTVIQRGSLAGIAGALAVIAGGVAYFVIEPGVLLAGIFSKVQVLHYAMAAGLLLLAQVKPQTDL
jgi:hypothetical protein